VTFEVRPCRDREELRRAIFAIGQYFSATPPSDEMLDRSVRVRELDRMHAALEDGEIVAGAAAFTWQLSVPGGDMLPCAGITAVGVYPTHRRRGALRALMRAQLDDVHARGEPLAALWASEETIYGRFGYGIASWAGEVRIPREWTTFVQPLERRGRVRFVTGAEALELFPPVWAELARRRPGMMSRPRDWWELRVLRTPDEEAAKPKRFVVLELDGETQAYAIYRQRMDWEAGVSTGRLEVLEAIGASAQATAELWRFLLDIDWAATYEASLLPPDHPLLLLLASPRRARYRMTDALWVRLVDVGAALSGRAYAAAGAIVFKVRDAFCPWNEGRWKLDDGRATRTDEPAELALDVDALGSAYLGAVSFAQLHDALRVEELAEGALARADALFGWRPLPWCPEIF
jgi:predicted acetyltransferase